MTTDTAVTAPVKQETKTNPDQPIKLYLRALKTSKKTGPGRPRTEATALKRIEEAQESLEYMRETGNVMEELRFAQKILDLQADLRAVRKDMRNDPANFEADFVKNAARYAKDNGITRQAWRRVGVTPDILTKAGL